VGVTQTQHSTVVWAKPLCIPAEPAVYLNKLKATHYNISGAGTQRNTVFPSPWRTRWLSPHATLYYVLRIY
jgi:hypothetical protein